MKNCQHVFYKMNISHIIWFHAFMLGINKLLKYVGTSLQHSQMIKKGFEQISPRL